LSEFGRKTIRTVAACLGVAGTLLGLLCTHAALTGNEAPIFLLLCWISAVFFALAYVFELIRSHFDDVDFDALEKESEHTKLQLAQLKAPRALDGSKLSEAVKPFAGTLVLIVLADKTPEPSRLHERITWALNVASWRILTPPGFVNIPFPISDVFVLIRRIASDLAKAGAEALVRGPHFWYQGL
jgi:hypothetical protein